jgi:hypothetical protein
MFKENFEFAKATRYCVQKKIPVPSVVYLLSLAVRTVALGNQLWDQASLMVQARAPQLRWKPPHYTVALSSAQKQQFR